MQQQPAPSVSRNSNTMDEVLETKIDSMVKSLIRDNQLQQLQSKRSRKQRRARNTNSATSSLSRDASQSYMREMVEAKLASALTSALVPNHPDNRSLYK